MTKDEALDLALEVMQINLKLLEKINPYKGQEDLLSDSLDLTHEAITAIKQARSAPVQEPVGTYGEIFESMLSLLRTGLQGDQQIYMAMKDKPLYTTPPGGRQSDDCLTAAQRQLVGLTEQEHNDIEDYCEMIIGKPAFEAIEAKLRSKNT